jgi:hypothetical protein
MQKSIHALSSCTLVRVVHLLVILVLLVVDDVEELELVDSLASGDDAEPVTELHLLEELLGPGERGEESQLASCIAGSKCLDSRSLSYRYLM